MAHVAGQLHFEAELEMLFHESSLAPAAPSLVKLEHNPSPVQSEQRMTRNRPDRESSNTGTKRRRLTTVKHESWAEAKNDIDAALSMVKSEGGTTDPDDNLENKLCFGCKRSSKTGTCFIQHILIVRALPDGRGQWCRDCFNCLRIVYSSKTSLVLFALWIKNPSNFREWELTLVAYITLRREGNERWTEAMIVSRRETLEYALRMLCLPVGPFEVRALRAVPDVGAYGGFFDQRTDYRLLDGH